MGKGVDHTRSLVLARHRERRGQGVPTLSVLVGDVDVASWCWTGWQGAVATPFVCTDAIDHGALLGQWLSSGDIHAALGRELAERGAEPGGVTREEFGARLGSHAEAQRPGAFEQLSAHVGWSASLIAATASASDEALAAWLRDGFPHSLAELASARSTGLPALLVRAPRAASPSELGSLLATLLAMVEAVPRLELACALTEAQLVRWRQEADARDLHLVREGLIRVEPAIEDPKPESEPPGARRRSRSSQRRAALSRTAPANGVPRLEYDAAEFARSRAELALFEHLQTRPRTRGLFALNGMIPEPFGSRPMEVDLLSEPLRVALEIDGYHHFRDATAYRRDRDKDIRLQRLGYTVVRVLASDVDAELELVIDTIDRVVEHERRRRTQ